MTDHFAEFLSDHHASQHLETDGFGFRIMMVDPGHYESWRITRGLPASPDPEHEYRPSPAFYAQSEQNPRAYAMHPDDPETAAHEANLVRRDRFRAATARLSH